jgi:hypothetical protein
MSGKKVTFAAKRPSEVTESNIQKWVENRDTALTPAAGPEPKIKMKRFTIDVPISLHRKIKSSCALRNVHMADEIRDLLEERFGGQGAGEGASS